MIPGNRKRMVDFTLGVGFAGLFTMCAWAMYLDAAPATAAKQMALSNLDDSGVGNPVTAVLLNFRSFDTLLELVVLYVVVLPMWMHMGKEMPAPAHTVGHDPVLKSLIRIITPISVVSGIYLLWNGANQPGGAFQAGAILAASLVLVHASTGLPGSLRALTLDRSVAVSGILFFALTALAFYCLMGQSAVFQYPVGSASRWIIAIEVVATVTIMTLLALFMMLLPEQDRQQ